jgi:hypothetical protein
VIILTHGLLLLIRIHPQTGDWEWGAALGLLLFFLALTLIIYFVMKSLLRLVNEQVQKNERIFTLGTFFKTKFWILAFLMRAL